MKWSPIHCWCAPEQLRRGWLGGPDCVCHSKLECSPHVSPGAGRSPEVGEAPARHSTLHAPSREHASLAFGGGFSAGQDVASGTSNQHNVIPRLGCFHAVYNMYICRNAERCEVLPSTPSTFLYLNTFNSR